jgi:heptosyltransferase-3
MPPSDSSEPRLASREPPVTVPQLLRATLVSWLRFMSALLSQRRRRVNRLAFRAAVKSLRRQLRHNWGRALRRIFPDKRQASLLDPEEIRSVLICRVNGRLGNTLLLTPLIKQIQEWLPNATIDLALAYPRARELLRDVPRIRRIIKFPYRIPQVLWAYLPAILRLRTWCYDLAIDPVPDSTSGRMALTLCRARYRLGFDTPSQWAPLTHPVAVPDETMHEAARPIYLLAQGLGLEVMQDATRLWLPLKSREVDAGRAAVARAVHARQRASVPAAAFGFFTHAAGTKRVERDWWLGFWQAFLALEPEAIPVEFLPLSGSKPIDARFPVLHVRSPRDMVAAISATRMFISPDTGPMHLASATEVPTVALFGNSNATRYHPMKASDICIDVTTCEPRCAAELCQRRWRAQRIPETQ